MNKNLVKQAARYLSEGETEKALVLLNRIIASGESEANDGQRTYVQNQSTLPMEKRTVGQP